MLIHASMRSNRPPMDYLMSASVPEPPGPVVSPPSSGRSPLPLWLRVLRWLGLSSLLVLAIWSVIWVLYARFLEQQLTALLEQPAPDGTVLRFGTSEMQGYPFGWHLHLIAPELDQPYTGTSLQADQLNIGFDLPDYRHYHWRIDGQTRLRLAVPAPITPRQPGAANVTGVSIGHVAITAGQASGSFELGPLGFRNPDSRFSDLTILVEPAMLTSAPPAPNATTDTSGEADKAPAIRLDAPSVPTDTENQAPDEENPLSIHVGDLTLALTSPDWPAAQAGETALTIDAALHDIRPSTLPRQLTEHGAMPDSIRQLAFNLSLTGPLPQGTHGYALNRWRETGGGITLHDLQLDLGDIGLTGEGIGGLDAQLQPAGQMNLQIRGFRTLLDRLLQEGSVKPAMATMLGTMFSMMARPGADGQPVIAMPLVLQDRWLMLGPIRLSRLPVVKWAREATGKPAIAEPAR